MGSKVRYALSAQVHTLIHDVISARDPGIISALAFSADASSGVYAAGSLSPPSPTSSNIAVFSEATGEVPVLYVGAEHEMDGHYAVRASVMQVGMCHVLPLILAKRNSSSCLTLSGRTCSMRLSDVDVLYTPGI